MICRSALPTLLALALTGCATQGASSMPTAGAVTITTLKGGATPLEGKAVTLVGRYEYAVIAKRPRDGAEEKAEPPGTDGPAWVVLDDDSRVLLGVYHRASGLRTAAEIARHHGKRVSVTGTFHAETPVVTGPDGAIGATLMAPWIEGPAIALAAP